MILSVSCGKIREWGVRVLAKWMVPFLSVCVLHLGLAFPAWGGAWTQKKGEYYLKISAAYLHATEDIDANGDVVQKALMGKLTDYDYSAYLEYGILDGLTLVASAPYRRLEDTRTFATGTAIERRSGFGDLDLRLRVKVLDRPFVMSVAAGGKIPLWYGNDPTTRVPLSTTHPDGDVRILMGRSLYPFPAYVTGEAGFRARGGIYSNEMFYALEGGVSLGRFLLKGRVSGIQTFGKCEMQTEVGLIGDQNVLKVSPGVVYRVDPRLELSLELAHVAAGCNTTAGNTVLFGVAVKR